MAGRAIEAEMVYTATRANVGPSTRFFFCFLFGHLIFPSAASGASSGRRARATGPVRSQADRDRPVRDAADASHAVWVGLRSHRRTGGVLAWDRGLALTLLHPHRYMPEPWVRPMPVPCPGTTTAVPPCPVPVRPYVGVESTSPCSRL